MQEGEGEGEGEKVGRVEGLIEKRMGERTSTYTWQGGQSDAMPVMEPLERDRTERQYPPTNSADRPQPSQKD